MSVDSIIFVAEIIGTVAFAISGVMIASASRMDFFGSLVLGATTAVGGGAVRDLFLGVTPPMMFRNPVYAIVAMVTSSIVFFISFFWGHRMKKHKEIYVQTINVFDAIGLAVFVIVGVNAAINAGYGDNGFLAVFVGTVTGIGGGVIRDVFSGVVPVVLRKHVYALAAIIGALLYYFLWYFGCPESIAIFISAAVIMLIRFCATYFKWNLPRIPESKVVH